MAYELKGVQNKMVAVERASTTVANTTVETRLTAAVYTIGSDQIQQGKVIRVRAWGRFGITATPTMILRVDIGGVDVVISPTITAAAGNGAWDFEAIIVCRTATATGTLFTHSITHGLSASRQISAPAATVAIDTTVNRDLDITAQWGAASALNTITCDGATIEIL